jgi:hypothetical protein
MASRRELHELVGRAIMDSEFMSRAKDDPIGAALSIGIQFTDAQAAWLSSNPPQWEAFVSRVGSSFGSGTASGKDCTICIVDGH